MDEEMMGDGNLSWSGCEGLNCLLESTTEPLDFVNSSGITNETEWGKWSSVIVMTVTSILLGLMILATIIGNFFVIAAVFFEKNLQNVANYLIVSLAVADLMVACLVMPLGAVYEVMGKWILGPLLCDGWTSVDVLCCTASILHLVAIALDRFWAVTDIEYIRNRNKRRINTMIAIVWLVGAVVSLLPFFGWKDPDYEQRLEFEDPKCLVSQDVGYQIFATCATFYVPLFIILLLYWKIWKTAQRRIRHRPGRIQQHNTHHKNSNCNLDTKLPSTVSSDHVPQCSRETTEFSINPSPTNLTPTTPTTHVVHENIEINTISKLVESVSSPSIEVTIEPAEDSKTSNGLDDGDVDEHHELGSTALSPTSNNQQQLNSPSSSPSSPHHGHPNFKNSAATSSPSSRSLQQNKKKNKKESIEAKRERKAAKTLAIITGAFVICWLPFFLMALIMPLCSVCSLPDYISSAFQWLGYFNSTLNPIIYTLNPEFRMAFKRILCGNRYRGRR